MKRPQVVSEGPFGEAEARLGAIIISQPIAFVNCRANRRYGPLAAATLHAEVAVQDDAFKGRGP